MELNVGMYHVRSDDGRLWLCKSEGLTPEQYTEAYKDVYKIKKTSYNPIDLIEEKDLVEIEFYSPRYEERVTRLFEVDFKHKNNITFGNVHCQLNIFDGEWGKHDQLLEPVIKTIATKEQFEQIQYRIGD